MKIYASTKTCMTQQFGPAFCNNWSEPHFTQCASVHINHWEVFSYDMITAWSQHPSSSRGLTLTYDCNEHSVRQCQHHKQAVSAVRICHQLSMYYLLLPYEHVLPASMYVILCIHRLLSLQQASWIYFAITENHHILQTTNLQTVHTRPPTVHIRCLLQSTLDASYSPH